ncbi:hypothetical protein [Desulfonema ishimotonii]|uniref:hypothetical protein n=1 Tax=Desulfonema ishimotonii TaxID=45657 RepID=UPI000F58E6A6|nr:hypothetical protein [Desulfonema ishimotonii]
MKILYPNLASLSNYSSEHESFPASNILDSHGMKKWRPADDDAAPWIKVGIAEGGNALMLYNVDADAVEVEIQDAIGDTVHTESFGMTGSSEWDTYNITRVWVEYPQQDVAHFALIRLTRGSDEPGIGVAFAGQLKAAFNDPLYGFSNTPKDHSVKWDLDNGYIYPYARNVQRIYAANLQIREREQYNAFMRVAGAIGTARPFALRMHDTAEPPEEWIIYACFGDIPKGALPKHSVYTVSFTVEEFL